MVNAFSPQNNAHLTKQQALKEIADKATRLFNSGNFEELKQQINSEPLAIWYGVEPHLLASWLKKLVHAFPEDKGYIYGLHLFLSRDMSWKFPDPSMLQMLSSLGDDGSLMLQLSIMLGHRLRGNSNEALHAATNAEVKANKLLPYVDAHDPWPLFSSVQRGITAMLAGDFQLALSLFTEAQFRNMPTAMVFLHRDALAKSALIHACYGSRTEARTRATQAQLIPKTISWVEAGIDTTLQIVESLTHEDPEQGFETFRKIKLNNVGEMWPFYLYALYSLHNHTGRHDELRIQLSHLARAPFPSVEGNGYTGSVLQIIQANLALLEHNVKKAREAIVSADHNLAIVQLTQALVDLHSTKTSRALETALKLHGQATGLRQFNLWRLSIIASIYYSLDNDTECLGTLASTVRAMPDLSANETLLFLKPVRKLGVKHIQSWPSDTPRGYAYSDELPSPPPPLTPREKVVLQALSEGKSRAEITADLYISLNTLKSQTRSLYRKLDASSRDEALRNATAFGLLN